LALPPLVAHADATVCVCGTDQLPGGAAGPSFSALASENGDFAARKMRKSWEFTKKTCEQWKIYPTRLTNCRTLGEFLVTFAEGVGPFPQ